MQLTAKTKFAELIHQDYTILPILNRFGILLGFGEKNVEQVCQQYGIDTLFFLEIANSFINKDFEPEKQLKDFPVRLIVDYLKKTHKVYIYEKLPFIEDKIKQLIEQNVVGNSNFRLIQQFFKDYSSELQSHIQREETIFYPYVFQISEAYETKTGIPEAQELIRKISIRSYAMQHDDVEEKLNDLKNIIIKYLPSVSDNSLHIKILYELFYLEKDLNDHSRIEDKVLVPKVLLLEQKILHAKSV
jgi:regulator of cell morphogenesis and NO signaling